MRGFIAITESKRSNFGEKDLGNKVSRWIVKRLRFCKSREVHTPQNNDYNKHIMYTVAWIGGSRTTFCRDLLKNAIPSPVFSHARVESFWLWLHFFSLGLLECLLSRDPLNIEVHSDLEVQRGC